MRALGKINFGVRPQAVSLLALSALFYLSSLFGLLLRSKIPGALDFACGLASVLSFLIAPVLAVVLLISHLRAGRSHRTLVYSAIIAAFSPWVLFLLLWLLAQSRVEYRKIGLTPAHALDGGIPSCFHIRCHWPAASDVRRWAV